MMVNDDLFPCPKRPYVPLGVTQQGRITPTLLAQLRACRVIARGDEPTVDVEPEPTLLRRFGRWLLDCLTPGRMC